MTRTDQLGNQHLVIPQGWQPRCRPQDKRRRHNIREVLARVARKAGVGGQGLEHLS